MGAIETKRRKRKLIIYDTLAFLFLAIAALIFAINHTFAVLAIPLLLVGLTIAAFALRLTLINFGSTHAIATRWGWTIGIPSVLLCGFLFWFELKSGQGEPKPNLTLALATSHAPGLALELPKNKLMAEPDLSMRHFPAVIIPLFVDETNVRLKFVVQNRSTNQIEGAEFMIWLPKSLQFNVEDNRMHRLTFPDGSGFDGACFVWQSPKILLFGDNDNDIPFIDFSLLQPSDPKFGNFIPVKIVIRAKDVEPTSFGFVLAFRFEPHGDPSLSPPKVVEYRKFITNGQSYFRPLEK